MGKVEGIGGKSEFASACRLFAFLLGVPDEDSARLVAELATVNPWLEEAAREAAALPLGHWQAEHTRLFICGYPKTVCPPFASHYKHGHMNGSVTQEVEDIYRRAGLELSDGLQTDYLGVMLECAAWLVETAGGQCGLLTELWVKHIDSWAPRFALDLQENAQTAFYRSLGEEIGRFMKEVS